MTAIRLFTIPGTSKLGGAVVPLPGRLFNAENLCVTDKGRLFVTGGQTIAEIDKTGQRYTQVPICIDVDGVPEHCMTTGIAAHGDFLYLACVRIHPGNNSFIPGGLCDVTKVEQAGMGLMLTYLAAFACSVESYIVRATLQPGRVTFAHLVAKLPSKFLANGLAADEKGAFLYVANSAPSLSAGIYRVPTQAPVGAASATLWCRPGCIPNGIKVGNGAVYYTGNMMCGMIPFAVLGKVRIKANDDGAEPQGLHGPAAFWMFDDFDLTDNGFVIAHFADYWRSDWLTRFGAGVLRFLDKDGNDLGVVDRHEIEHPSAVAVVKKGPLFDAGDIVATDKGRHRVIVCKRLTP